MGGEVMDKLTIKQIRLLNGLTQEKMALKVGMKLETYKRKEQGKSGFSFSEVLKICSLFDIPINKIRE